jgi:hypothetical protein
MYPPEAFARKAEHRSAQPTPAPLFETNRDVHRDPPLRSSLAADTTMLGSWDFEGCNPQGWTSVDRTLQDGTFFHVDDFAGMAPPYAALEGAQSMWCGLRDDPGNAETCAYASLPGYGDYWEQRFATVSCFNVTGDVTVDYLIAWDSEPNYDYTTLQYDQCDGDWIDLEGGRGVWDDVGSGVFSSTIADSVVSDSLRLRFSFVSDVAWSDVDAFYDSDGAVILDSLTVSDAGGVVLATETFEAESPGDLTTTSGNWTATVAPGYGDYAGLFPGMTVLQEGPCQSNITCIWAFFNGSTADYGCGGHPEQPAVPYGNERDQYLSNDIWSPWMSFDGTGNRIVLEFDAYGDTQQNPLVFYVTKVRSMVDGCLTQWTGPVDVWFQPEKVWQRRGIELDPYVDPAATEIQVALGVRDLCEELCGYIGTGDCHSHAPLFDNVRVYRTHSIPGPLWDVETDNLFQDTFPADGSTTGIVRADMSFGITLERNDSVVVTIETPASEPGLDTDPYTGTGPAAYAYVSVLPAQAGKRGAALSGDGTRWPVVDSLLHNGDTWYCMRFDTSFAYYGPAPDEFCLDLNDSLFTPGDTVRFFFSATSGAGTTYWSEFTGRTPDLSEAASWPMEFTGLPTNPPPSPYRILHVDYADGTGAQTAFDDAFDALGMTSWVDRYDVRGDPFVKSDNGPGSRVVDPIVQLANVYDLIIWSGGSTEDCLGIGAFPGYAEDSDLLAIYMAIACPGAIYFSGDNVASSVAQAGSDLSPYISFSVVSGDHVQAGYDSSPLVVAEPGGCFDHANSDTLLAFPSCYPPDNFDIVSPTGASVLEASYLSGGGGGAIVSQRDAECGGSAGGVILSGFGFETIANDRPSSVLDATAHMSDVIAWLLDVPTDVESPSPRRNTLSQNIPNPFNPTTSIRYAVRERGRVQIRVYNVAGQLVTTLVDGEASPGVEHVVEWDGHNDAGQRVASGVYFYRMTAPGFVKTKKMVLLK